MCLPAIDSRKAKSLYSILDGSCHARHGLQDDGTSQNSIYIESVDRRNRLGLK